MWQFISENWRAEIWSFVDNLYNLLTVSPRVIIVSKSLCWNLKFFCDKSNMPFFASSVRFKRFYIARDTLYQKSILTALNRMLAILSALWRNLFKPVFCLFSTSKAQNRFFCFSPQFEMILILRIFIIAQNWPFSCTIYIVKFLCRNLKFSIPSMYIDKLKIVISYILPMPEKARRKNFVIYMSNTHCRADYLHLHCAYFVSLRWRAFNTPNICQRVYII